MPFTPNMNLPEPVIGSTPAPTWAELLNQALTLIDAHDHSSGHGVQITPDGLDINADITFQENNALSLRSVRFEPQNSPLGEATDLGCVYVAGADLYYNDISGNQIRFTQNGAIAGTPGSIANLAAPASASYDSGTATFIWQSDVNTPAKMDSGPIIIRELAANGSGITIEPHTSISSDYTLTLPAALPAGADALVLTNSSGGVSYKDLGTASYPLMVTAAGTALEYAQLRTAGIANGAITQAKLATKGVTKSAAFTQTTDNTSYTTVTSASVTVSATGNRPIRLYLETGDSSNVSAISVGAVSTTAAAGSLQVFGDVQILEDGVVINDTRLGGFIQVLSGGPGTTGFFIVPNSSLSACSPAPSAGSHTYTMKFRVATSATGLANTNINLTNLKLCAYED